jgi:hypothetical protein
MMKSRGPSTELRETGGCWLIFQVFIFFVSSLYMLCPICKVGFSKIMQEP